MGAARLHTQLFLDTFPYGAHTTCSEAMYAGLPILTRPGVTFASRVAASLLYALFSKHHADDARYSAQRSLPPPWRPWPAPAAQPSPKRALQPSTFGHRGRRVLQPPSRSAVE